MQSTQPIYQHHPALGLLLLLGGQLWFQGSFQAPALALPQNGQVQAGQATIQQPNSQQLTIQQQSDRAVIDWQSFNIGAQEQVQINQPDVNAALLNRVTGATPSSIAGTLRANGQVMLVNPNGVVFTPTAVVGVGGLLATTLNISNRDFMAGKLNLYQEPGLPLGTVENQGSITVAEGGLAALVAPHVRNSGVIHARLGQVVLAAGTQATLDFYGDGLIAIAVPDDVAARLGIDQTGSLQADGGWVAISAATGASLLESVVNTDGIVRARAVENRNGTIVLSGGDVTVAGTVDASGTNPGEAGGTVTIDGGQVQLPSGLIDVSGQAGGGSLLVYADDLSLGIQANGDGGTGPGGYALFDPVDFTVDAAAAGTLVTSLNTLATVDVEASNSITVDAAIDSSAQGNSNTLNFKDENADGNLTINLNAKITLGANQSLTGDGTTVNVATTGGVQNGVDVAAAGATVNLAAATFTEGAEITIGKNLTLQGQGQTQTMLDGGDTHRVVNVSGGTVTIDGVTIQNGRVNGGGSGGGIYNNNGTVNVSNTTISGNTSATGFGGGINNQAGTINISNATISSNSSLRSGGGIFNRNGTVNVSSSTISGNRGISGGGISNLGTVNVSNSTISSNNSRSYGGGIDNNGGTVDVSGSTISGNTANRDGGGIDNLNGTVDVSNSTITGNEARRDGGGISNRSNGVVNVSNSTISGNNSRAEGGGIYTRGTTLNVSSSTISGNSSGTSGGGIYSSSGTTTITNTIVANSTGGDTSGTIGTSGNNLVEDGSVAGALSGDPNLAPLGDYGGPQVGDPNAASTLQTHALLLGSSALDAGDNAFPPPDVTDINNNGNTTEALTTDQRGQNRIVGAAIDLGAYESGGFVLSPLAGDNQSTTIDTPFGTNLSVQVVANTAIDAALPTSGLTITFTPPGSGASGSFTPGNTAITNASGIATANPFTANAEVGNFTVSATLPGATPGTFNLSNTSTPPPTPTTPTPTTTPAPTPTPTTTPTAPEPTLPSDIFNQTESFSTSPSDSETDNDETPAPDPILDESTNPDTPNANAFVCAQPGVPSSPGVPLCAAP
jgi:filamentous hemagglutinin family protein